VDHEVANDWAESLTMREDIIKRHPRRILDTYMKPYLRIRSVLWQCAPQG